MCTGKLEWTHEVVQSSLWDLNDQILMTLMWKPSSLMKFPLPQEDHARIQHIRGVSPEELQFADQSDKRVHSTFEKLHPVSTQNEEKGWRIKQVPQTEPCGAIRNRK